MGGGALDKNRIAVVGASAVDDGKRGRRGTEQRELSPGDRRRDGPGVIDSLFLAHPSHSHLFSRLPLSLSPPSSPSSCTSCNLPWVSSTLFPYVSPLPPLA